MKPILLSLLSAAASCVGLSASETAERPLPDFHTPGNGHCGPGVNLLHRTEDAYGTVYETKHCGSRGGGYTILRQGEKPVERKRRERAERKRLAAA